MRKTIRIVLSAFIALLGLAAFQYPSGPPGRPARTNGLEVLAHRGAHQILTDPGPYHGRGCEAAHIEEPRHFFIENTLESIETAFEHGASIVEIDVRRTKDGELVLFHDHLLDCKTNGTGAVVDRTLDYLKRLDLGYGYTPDQGATFPLRGKGIGLTPTLRETLARFPDKRFLIDQKDGELETAKILTGLLRDFPPEQRARLGYWGEEPPLRLVRQSFPEINRMFAPPPKIRKWLLTYLLTLGLAPIPEESRGLVLAMPCGYTKIFWGWPNRFLRKVDRAGAEFYLIIDSPEAARIHQDAPMDGIVTDHIQTVGPYFQKRNKP